MTRLCLVQDLKTRIIQPKFYARFSPPAPSISPVAAAKVNPSAITWEKLRSIMFPVNFMFKASPTSSPNSTRRSKQTKYGQYYSLQSHWIISSCLLDRLPMAGMRYVSMISLSLWSPALIMINSAAFALHIIGQHLSVSDNPLPLR